MTDWYPMSADTAARLAEAGLDPVGVATLIAGALDEDLDGGEDVTSAATVPDDQRSVLDLVARRRGVIAGAPVAAAVFDMVGGDDCQVTIAADDGSHVQPGDVVVSAAGATRDLLTAERTALNLLCHLSGVATATDQWVQAARSDRRAGPGHPQDNPGMRRLEKYAVRCGGGVNHRMSLSDAALVKDNHVLAAGGVVAAFEAVRQRFPGLPIEVEVDSLEQLAEVLDAGADLVLLDNFTPEQMIAAVEINAGRSVLEASGGLTLDMAAEVGATGVDYLAVGALTHSAPALDIGADLRS